MADAGVDQLHAAIARNKAVVLSLPSAGMSRQSRSRFLARDADGSIWAEATADEDALIEELIAAQKPVSVIFKTGTQRVTFSSPIIRFSDTYQVNEQTRVRAVLLASPSQVQIEQRRSCYRVRVFQDSELSVRLWRIAEQAALSQRPQPSMESSAELIDLSVGGIGVRFAMPKAGESKIVDGQRIRIEFLFRGASILLDGHTRPISPVVSPDTAPRVGIRFSALDVDLESRQKASQLSAIIAELERDEVRRKRRAMA